MPNHIPKLIPLCSAVNAGLFMAHAIQTSSLLSSAGAVVFGAVALAAQFRPRLVPAMASGPRVHIYVDNVKHEVTGGRTAGIRLYRQLGFGPMTMLLRQPSGDYVSDYDAFELKNGDTFTTHRVRK